MRDQEAGAALHQVSHRFHDYGLCFKIYGAGGFIKDQDGSVFEEGASERNALALSAGEANTALADLCLVTRGQLLDELVDVRCLRRSNDLRPAGRGTSICDVFRNAAGKENGILSDNRGLVAQVRQFVIAKVNPVEKNAPFRRIVETQQQVDERRFPRPGGSDNTDSHAGLDLRSEEHTS